MNGMNPNCLDDFIFSNPNEKALLEMILSRQLPFPLGGKTARVRHFDPHLGCFRGSWSI